MGLVPGNNKKQAHYFKQIFQRWALKNKVFATSGFTRPRRVICQWRTLRWGKLKRRDQITLEKITL
jgi:hypothetical protein